MRVWIAVFTMIWFSAAGLFAQKVNFIECDLQTVIATAMKRNAKVLVYLHTTWCGNCKGLEHDIFNFAEPADYINKNYLSLQFDAEKGEGPDIMKRYNLAPAYPTVLLLDSNGAEIERMIGSPGLPEAYLQTLKEYTAGRGTIKALKRQLSKDKHNSRLLKQLAEHHARRAEYSLALRHFEDALLFSNLHDEYGLHMQVVNIRMVLEREKILAYYDTVISDELPDRIDASRSVTGQKHRAQLYFHKGMTLQWQHKWDEAAIAMAEAVRLDPDKALYRTTAGRLKESEASWKMVQQLHKQYKVD